MTGLIEQIQRAALDQNIPVSTLLRQLKLAAAKLQLSETEDWVEKELNGYLGEPAVPEYRMLRGTPSAWNPYHGWIPIYGTPSLIEKLSIVPEAQSIEALEMLASKDDVGTLVFPYSPEVVNMLNKGQDVHLGRMGAICDQASLLSIINRVRNLILDWAIRLEKLGVKGEGFSFTATEKAKAHDTSFAVQNLSIHNFAGNFGVGNTAGAITQSTIDLDQLRSLLSQVRQHAPSLEAEGVKRADLDSRLDAIEAELCKGTPDHGILRGLLIDLRAVATGAAGNVIGSGILFMINQMLGTGVPGA